MRHQKTGKKLGRNSSHRRAMWRNLVTSLIVHERVTTTDVKAKELRRLTERIVTKATRVSSLAGKSPKALSQEERAKLVHARRVAARHLRPRATDGEMQDIDVLYKLFEDLGPRFAERPGGYLRITKLPHLRKGDGAPMSVVEFVEGPAAEAAAAGGRRAAGGKEEKKGLLGRILGGRKKKDEPDDDDDDE